MHGSHNGNIVLHNNACHQKKISLVPSIVDERMPFFIFYFFFMFMHVRVRMWGFSFIPISSSFFLFNFSYSFFQKIERAEAQDNDNERNNGERVLEVEETDDKYQFNP